MSYVLMIVGLIIMCVPEETSLTRFFIQGIAGLIVFGIGALLTMDEQEQSV